MDDDEKSKQPSDSREESCGFDTTLRSAAGDSGCMVSDMRLRLRLRLFGVRE